MNSEIISLETFRKMWNGETYIEHNQMVDALDDKSVWEFVLDETTNGSTKVFEFFTEAEMPSKSALIQLMNTVPNELFGLNAEELKERIGENNNFVNFAIVYYVLLEKTETPEFYKYNVGEMYYDGFRLVQPLCQNETERLNKRIKNIALQYDTSDLYYHHEKEECFEEAENKVKGIPKDSAFVTYLKWNFWSSIFMYAILIIALVVSFIIKHLAPVLFVTIVVGLVALLIWILRK